ncbi:unnamed protein product [Hymenolepis diminuta]|uniref:Uncharacterized protein n=1 Tax=Hymenolepis diminuta TaxID=6216 RepID=A0A564Y7R3_HYMDI|nr:unnamed protein product [Hymenolepis diminuta]
MKHTSVRHCPKNTADNELLTKFASPIPLIIERLGSSICQHFQKGSDVSNRGAIGGESYSKFPVDQQDESSSDTGWQSACRTINGKNISNHQPFYDAEEQDK